MPNEQTDYLGDSLPAHPNANAASCRDNETCVTTKGSYTGNWRN